MTARLLLSFRLLLSLAAIAFLAAPAAAQDAGVQTTWRLLDYIAVDYREAVQGGKVVNPAEYQEMEEFSATVREGLAKLPAKPAKAQLSSDAQALQAAIAAKAAPDDIAKRARGLAGALLTAYPVPLAPQAAPDLARGEALYRTSCASCHGLDGKAGTPMSEGMDPPPIAFADRGRAAERSVFGLYQVIDQGLEGTAMGSFGHLPAEDKWALAFYAGRFAYPEALAAEGKRLWESDASLRRRIPDLAALTGITPAALAAQIGEDKAIALTAYLRANPSAVSNGSEGGAATLQIARERLRQSVAAYRAGDAAAAKSHALAAYLDGFEPVEPVLNARDSGLMARVEAAMAGLRAAIADGVPADQVAARAAEVEALLGEAEKVLAPGEASSASAFLGAFSILLREGLEALLIIVAMLTFLRKAERPEMVRTVHYGWATALLAGVATWWAATHLITISGAGRELTEGFGALFAAVVLLFVGIWMHGKAQADEWQRYLKEKLGTALTRGSAWFLFVLAFVAVYREVFETILFFAALSAEGNVGSLFLGGAAGVVCLTAIAIAMFRFSKRLPIAKFFAYSALLMAILAVVLAGKGVGALQEAGMIGVTPLASFPRVPILGLTPSLETVGAQVVTLVLLVLGFTRNRRGGLRPAAA
ncbi:MAG TPA: FTR1 family protein [Allosphingosinicella sp.]|jgi:high-affinity iron transporter